MYLWRNTVTISALTSGDTTTYSSNQVNGYIAMVSWSTGSSTAVFSSTCNLVISGELSGITFARIPIATPPITVFPRTAPASSSGGIFPAASTTLWFPEKFPLANERIIVQTSGGSTVAPCGLSVQIYTEGSRL